MKRDSLHAEAARGGARDTAFLFFTSGTTGPAKGAVFTHAALIDRARVAAAAEGLRDSDVAMAYLSPGWIGQSLFTYIQSLVVGYCICCPESSETLLADMREIGPTYLFAPPRVLEALLTQVVLRMEDAGWISRTRASCVRVDPLCEHEPTISRKKTRIHSCSTTMPCSHSTCCVVSISKFPATPRAHLARCG